MTVAIWRARPLDHRFYGTAGQVGAIEDAGVSIVCGDGRAVLLEVVSRDGGPRMEAREVLRSTSVRLRDLAQGVRP